MGEARSKRTRTQRFLERNRFCCFCGGTTPATTVDHVPAIQIFSLKQRPKGLEFPACAKCNHDTGPHEQVAAMIARMLPDPSSQLEKEELRKLMQAVKRNNPGLLEEMFPSWRQQYDYRTSKIGVDPTRHPLNAAGPILNHSMQIFGAKIGMAFHYQHTGGILPPQGAVGVRWFSNYEALDGEIPDVAALFRNRETLKQGKIDVSEQFEYSWAALPEGTASAYFAAFRMSFAVTAFVDTTGELFSGTPVRLLYAPGFTRIEVEQP